MSGQPAATAIHAGAAGSCEAMTGLVAIFAHGDECDVSSANIDALAATYQELRGGELRETPGNGRMRAALIGVEGSPTAGLEARDGSWAAFTGVVYDRSSLLDTPLEELDGHFGLIRFRDATATAEVATDPMGIQSVFVARQEQRTYVSTSALALARHLRAQVDRIGVLTFLRAGFLFGEGTEWEGVRRLDPGTALELRPTSSTRRTYWRAEVDEAVRKLPLERAVDHALEVCLETFGRYLRARACTWADVSGGYDSRLLALALDRAGVSFSACTRGDPGDPEVEIAHRIAELERWPWTRFSYPADFEREVADLFRPALVWADAHQPIIQTAQRFWKHVRTAAICPSLVGGGAGELWRNFAWQQEFLRAGHSTRVNLDNWIDMRLVHPMPTGVFVSDPTPVVRDDMARRSLSWLEPYRGELNTTKLDLLYAYKSTGTFGIQGSAERLLQIRHWPYLYRPLVATAISMNHRHRAGHRLMRHMIERLDPRVAAIETYPWGGPAQPMRVRNVHRFLPYYRDVATRATAKISQKAIGRSPRRRAPEDERRLRLYRTLLEHADSIIEGGLHHATMRSAPLFRAAELDTLLADARQGVPRAPDLVDRLVTVELALQAADAALER